MTVLVSDLTSDDEITYTFISENRTVTVKRGVVVENTMPEGPGTTLSEVGKAFAGEFDGNQLNNNGSIYARGYGVYFDGASTINNSRTGTIAGDSAIVFGYGAGPSTIANDGAISGRRDAINFTSEHLDVFNSGTISGGVGFWAIYSFTGGLGLVNLGRITGAVSASGEASDIRNAGTIDGSVGLSNSADVVRNTGRINGDIGFGDGADRFDGRGGTVTGDIRGDEGDDLYIVDSLAMANQIVERVGEGADTLASTFSMNVASFANIENLTLLGSAALNLTGDGRANVLKGNAGLNTLVGGAGDDTYFVQNAGDRVVEAANGGVDTVHAAVSWTLGANVENLTLQARPGEVLRGVGNALDNVITDGSYSSSILDGGAGADVMNGNGGSDTFYVDNPGDVITGPGPVQGLGYYDTVYTSVSYSVAGLQVDKIIVLGNAGLTLVGSDIENEFVDGAGADTLIGGKGSDTYTVSQATDVVREAANGGEADTVYAKVSYALGSGQEIEQLRAVDPLAKTAINLAGNDVVTPRAQTLVGNAGANVLDGRGGSDVLTGLGGADAFMFRSALGASNVDTITDFSHADDTIRLSKSVFAALATVPLAASAFKDFADPLEPIDGSDRILYNHENGALFYDADGSGSGTAVQFAILINRPLDLDASDFVVIA